MPRVNRDLQRRLDARRERERRPTAVQRYRFKPAAPADAPVDDIDVAAPDVATPSESSLPKARAARVAAGRPVARPYASYAPDYAYVPGDLRRLALIVGLLLLALVVLSLVAHP